MTNINNRENEKKIHKITRFMGIIKDIDPNIFLNKIRENKLEGKEQELYFDAERCIKKHEIENII